MGKVRTGHSTSLDGFIAGPNDGPDAPMGEGGEPIELESTRVIEGVGVTHLTFRVVK